MKIARFPLCKRNKFYFQDTRVIYYPHIQVSYSMEGEIATAEREITGLMKIGEKLSCRRRMIVTYEEDGMIEREGIRIEIIPAWKFLLSNNTR